MPPKSDKLEEIRSKRKPRNSRPKLEQLSDVVVKLTVIDQRPINERSYALFGLPLDEETKLTRKYEIDLESWEDMGSPEEITLYAVPGNELDE